MYSSFVPLKMVFEWSSATQMRGVVPITGRRHRRCRTRTHTHTRIDCQES